MTKEKAYGICLYKKNKNGIEILLCKSTQSKKKWGFLKGVAQDNETQKQTAIREFYEESSIRVNYNHLENYFEQKNKDKDIGVFLVNYDRIGHINRYFSLNKLYSKYLSWENSNVTFFDINSLPEIKKKQIKLVEDVVLFLKKGK